MNHDPTEPVDVRICLIVSINASLGDRVEQTIRSAPSSVPVDVIHRFNIPSNPGSMRLQEDLINPNHYTGKEPLYNPDTDTIGIFFRCNGDNTDAFIQQPEVEVLLVDFPSVGFIGYDRTPFPEYHSPHTDEQSYSIRLAKTSMWASSRIVLDHWYFPSKVGLFTSLNSVIAPKDPGVYGNRYPYKDGIQAIQMAGNAQADNHDAWYKLSHLTCLGPTDVLVGFFVNHALIRNSLFCSVNIVNKNKAFGIHEISSEKFNTPYYVVLTGRDQEILSKVADSIRKTCTDDVFVHEFWLETGDFKDQKTPICDQILIVERTYVYPYVTDQDGKEYYYTEIPENKYTLLREMTGVDGTKLADPIIIKYTHKPWVYIVILGIIVVYVCFLLTLIFVKLNKNKNI
jgi:hypothetical protein